MNSSPTQTTSLQSSAQDCPTGDLWIRTCGELQVWKEGQLQTFSARSAAELLCYLHAHPAGVYRSAIVLDLWGIEDEQAAAGRFRVALHRLRSTLASPKTSGIESVQERAGRYFLHPEVLAASDVGQMRFWRAQALAASDGQQRIAALEKAKNALQGEYLPHLQAAWVQSVREELLAEKISLGLSLYSEQCAARDCHCALENLLATTALDPLLGEEAQQDALTCLAQQRGAVAATDYYRRYVRYLRSEVGDTPLAETEQLMAQIRRGEAVCAADLRPD